MVLAVMMGRQGAALVCAATRKKSCDFDGTQHLQFKSAQGFSYSGVRPGVPEMGRVWEGSFQVNLQTVYFTLCYKCIDIRWDDFEVAATQWLIKPKNATCSPQTVQKKDLNGI
jgi:hypothetical protein